MATPRKKATQEPVHFPCCEQAIDHISQLHDTHPNEGRWALLIYGHVREPSAPPKAPDDREGMTMFEVEIIFCPWCGAKIGRVPV